MDKIRVKLINEPDENGVYTTCNNLQYTREQITDAITCESFQKRLKEGKIRLHNSDNFDEIAENCDETSLAILTSIDLEANECEFSIIEDSFNGNKLKNYFPEDIRIGYVMHGDIGINGHIKYLRYTPIIDGLQLINLDCSLIRL